MRNVAWAAMTLAEFLQDEGRPTFRVLDPLLDAVVIVRYAAIK